ncbi:MAG: sulfotransferase family 2 domain-containing protein [Pseudomonadota bacterium]
MFISHKRQLIFIHLPKTGGTSLTIALENQAASDDIIIGDTPEAEERQHRFAGVKASGRLWKHSHLNEIYGLVTPSQINTYLKITIARNPWDRMVSYYHWLRVQTFKHHAVALARSLEFEAFATHANIGQSFRQNSICTAMTDKNGAYRADFVLRFESLQEDANRLSNMLGVKLGQLPLTNTSKRRRNYKEYYSDRSRSFVADACEEDISMMSYTFD